MTFEELKEAYPYTASLKLSENFQLGEFAVTNVFGKEIAPEQLLGAVEHEINISRLVEYVLQDVRDKFGEVTINSGFRSSFVNQMARGSAASDHLTGKAADFVVKDLGKCYDWIRSNLVYDQCILYKTFIHVSYRWTANRKQSWIAY
jgi:hypothetical protein